METGTLLKSLINIAGLKQNSFAESIYMSPSMLSKIVCGNRNVSLEDAGDFSANAARILADGIFAPDCYLKFEGIFALIKDFPTKYDLEQFLTDAIRYHINKDCTVADASGRHENSEHYSGHPQIQNMLCILCSDHAQSAESMEIYTTLPQHVGHYSSLQNGIKVLAKETGNRIVIHQLINPEVCRSVDESRASDLILSLYQQENFANLYRWQTTLTDTTFSLLKDKCVLHFNTLLDGTLHMTLVRKQTDVQQFSNAVADIMKEAVCMSAGEHELPNFLSNVPRLEERTVARKIRAFIDLNWKQSKPEDLRALFDSLTQDDGKLYLSADVIPAFLNADKVNLPAWQIASMSHQKRLEYLSLIQDLAESNPQALRIINAPLNSIILLCPDNPSLLCLVNPATRAMKYHLVDSKFLKSELIRMDANFSINAVDYMDALIRNSQKDLKLTERQVLRHASEAAM